MTTVEASPVNPPAPVEYKLRFAEGDLVRLRSGGPTMTVVEVRRASVPGVRCMVRCFWFGDSCTEVSAESFPIGALVPYPSDPEATP